MKINESIISAGFGGQGVMLLGKVLATAGMEEDLFVTWFPSYGVEVRGGTAHSMVKINSEPIADPIVTSATVAVIMNDLSLRKFEERVVPGGLLILNSSMINHKSKREDVDIVEAPLTDEAVKLGNIRVANIIAGGIFLAKKKIFSKESTISAMKKISASAGRSNLIKVNIAALEKGIEIGDKT